MRLLCVGFIYGIMFFFILFNLVLFSFDVVKVERRLEGGENFWDGGIKQ